MLVINPDDDLAEQTPRARPLVQRGEFVDLPYKHGMLDIHTGEIAKIVNRFLNQ